MTNLPLRTAVQLFLGDKIATTRSSYEYMLNFMCGYIGPERPLDQVLADDLLAFAQWYADREEVRSSATYNKMVKTARTFFNFWVKARRIPFSPAAAVTYRKQKANVERSKAMPDEHYETLVDFAKWDDGYDYALVLLLGDSACRIGGAAGLKWSDVDLQKQTATVTEKGKDPRPILFKKECARALEIWRRRQDAFSDSAYVFSKDGQPMTTKSLAQHFRRICVRCKIGSYGPHSLRHRKGYQMSDRRISPSVAATVLGDTVEITLKYYYPKDYARAREIVEELGYELPAHERQRRRILPLDQDVG